MVPKPSWKAIKRTIIRQGWWFIPLLGLTLGVITLAVLSWAGVDPDGRGWKTKILANLPNAFFAISVYTLISEGTRLIPDIIERRAFGDFFGLNHIGSKEDVALVVAMHPKKRITKPHDGGQLLPEALHRAWEPRTELHGRAEGDLETEGFVPVSDVRALATLTALFESLHFDAPEVFPVDSTGILGKDPTYDKSREGQPTSADEQARTIERRRHEFKHLASRRTTIVVGLFNNAWTAQINHEHPLAHALFCLCPNGRADEYGYLRIPPEDPKSVPDLQTPAEHTEHMKNWVMRRGQHAGAGTGEDYFVVARLRISRLEPVSGSPDRHGDEPRWAFVAGGVNAHGTMLAAKYLTSNWRSIHRKVCGRSFVLCVRFGFDRRHKPTALDNMTPEYRVFRGAQTDEVRAAKLWASVNTCVRTAPAAEATPAAAAAGDDHAPPLTTSRSTM